MCLWWQASVIHCVSWNYDYHYVMYFVLRNPASDAILQYIPRNMHTVFALLCFVVVIYWLIFPYPSGLLHWHCGNLTIAPVPAKQPWWIWLNTSCEFIMKDCITTTKQSTTKPCAYFLGYTVWHDDVMAWRRLPHYWSCVREIQPSHMVPSQVASNVELLQIICCQLG